MPGEQARPAIRACGNPSLPATGELSPDDVGLLAYGLTHPGWQPVNCVRRNPAAALALLEAYVGDPVRLDSGRLALWRLFELYDERSDARARQRRDEIRRILWLRGEHVPPPGDPLLTRAEQERQLSEAANLGFLRQWVARYPADPNSRRMLLRALLLEGSPHFDPVEAASVLTPDDPFDVRLRLIAALAADRTRMPLALEQLRSLNFIGSRLAPENASIVAAIITRAADLLRAGEAPTRETGARLLAALAANGVADARTALFAAAGRAGGMVELTAFPSDMTVRPLFVTAEDYPAAALRSEEGGLVPLHAVFGPDGRLLLVDTAPAEPGAVTRAAARMWRARSLRGVELRGYRGHFVRIAGPTVEFRIACVAGGDQPLPPPAPGRITLDGQCLLYPNFDTPIAVR